MAARKRKTTKSRVGRTASGRIKKGYRLSKGGKLTKCSTSRRCRVRRKSRR